MGHDWSFTKELFTGPESNGLSYGVIGHADPSPAYLRITNNEVYVEVTLKPTGEEIIARVPIAHGQPFGPLECGNDVVVAFPGTSGEDAVVLAKLSNNTNPLPETAGGITIPQEAAPVWYFLRTDDGQLLGIESGEGADICIHAGGSIRLSVNAGEQVLIAGRTHIGADFTTPPIGATAGPASAIIPGTPGVAFIPTPHVPLPAAPLPLSPFVGPADGALRVKDSIQSDGLVDPAFWAWVLAVSAAPQVVTAMASAGIIPPVALTVAAKTASYHTVSD